MELKECKFIQLNDNKEPVHKLDTFYDFEEVKNRKNLAIFVENPYVVVDVDNEENYNLLKRIINDEKVNCKIMKTTRGGHFWFRTEKPLINNVKINTPLTFDVDIRSWGKKSYVKVKDNGKWRLWEKDSEICDDIPFWLSPISHTFDFIGAREGDGRNDKMFRYIITLTNAGLSKDQIRYVYKLINRYVLRDSMPEAELNTILRDSSFDKLKPAFFDGKSKRFKFEVFANFYKNDNNIVKKFGRLYIYDEGCYVDDYDRIESKMVKYISTLSRAQRTEVMAYLKLIAEEPPEIPIYYIVCKNGVVDIRNKQLGEFTNEFFVPNKIHTNYDQSAYDENVDKLLDKLCGGNKELRQLIEEMIGYILIPTARFQKSFILYGDGSNGKSTLLEMISAMIGENNISSLSLKELNHNFKLSDITNKMANIGDDISDEYIQDSSIFKKLVTGEEILVDKKNKDPYKLRNYATMVFACNNLPNMFDKSNGMIRRLTVIPFNAIISKTDPDYDPFIIDKVTTENAKSYLLKLGIEGVTRVFVNNKFTEPRMVEEMLHEYEEEINNVLQFMKGDREVIGMSSADLYSDYKFWCAENGTVPYKIRKFNHEIKVKYGYDLVVKRIGKQTNQVWSDEK